jgi:hypothetical protein
MLVMFSDTVRLIGLCVQLSPQFWLGAGTAAREVEGDAMSADTGFRVRHATSYERVAVVSDEDWIRPALRALSFLLPGKARGFRVRDLAEAKAWLAEDGA